MAIYRPGSSPLSDCFFSEFDTLLDSLSLHSCPTFLLGDINIHLNDEIDHNTERFCSAIDSRNYHQLVTEPTHAKGHTLDVFITGDPSTVKSLKVDPPLLSDHSLIRVETSLKLRPAQRKVIYRRSWSRLDKDSFLADLMGSDLKSLPLLTPAGVTTEEITRAFTTYDATLTSLADKHAPVKKITIRQTRTAVWFDSDCAQ